jgi:hypothetical protein
MKTWSFYAKETGLFVDLRHSAMSDAHLEINTPPGTVAIEGVFDHLSERVDLAATEAAKKSAAEADPAPIVVVGFQPQQPSSEHEWNATTKRWQVTAAAEARALARASALAQIGALETAQHRAVREAVLGIAAGIVALQKIDQQIAALRAQLSA